MASINGGQTGQATFTETPAAGVFNGQPVQIPSARTQHVVKPGTAQNQLDGLACLVLNLAASTPQTVNLEMLTDVFGNPLTVARVNFLLAKILTGTDGATVELDGSGSNGFTGLASAGAPVFVYPPDTLAANDGFTMFSAPGATGMVVTSTTKNISVNPGSTAQTLLLMIGTRSA